MRADVRQQPLAQAKPNTLDERLALTGLEMDALLAKASAAINVNTAHIHIDEMPNDFVVELPALPEPPCPYTTPIAQLLHRARPHLEAGWCTQVLRDEKGAVCLLGSIRAAGATGADYDRAADILYEVIRRIAPADSVSGWNDLQATSRGPLIVLERAARLASDRGL